jgi:hypothetical protein
VLANFVKRSALDESSFRGTSRALIADPVVRDQVAATLVDQLYANVDVPGALRQRLPANMQGLAGPIAGAVRDAADRSARQLLERPPIQDAFVNASSPRLALKATAQTWQTGEPVTKVVTSARGKHEREGEWLKPGTLQKMPARSSRLP